MGKISHIPIKLFYVRSVPIAYQGSKCGEHSNVLFVNRSRSATSGLKYRELFLHILKKDMNI